MAQFKNISGRAVILIIGGLAIPVASNATVTVADKDAEGIASQTSNWQAMDTAATNALAALSGTAVVTGEQQLSTTLG